MTHIKYNPGAEGTGIFVFKALSVHARKAWKQKSQMSWLCQGIGIVFAGVGHIWITQIIQKSGAPGIVPSCRRAGLQKRFSSG
ncbi:MAG: hypothetical protein WBV45_07930, partial [Lutimonas sp.]